MRYYQTIQISRHVFPIILFIACLVCHPSFAQTKEAIPLVDPNAVLLMLTSAVNVIEQPFTGRGTATMKIENYLKSLNGKELTVNFVFKDRKSRVDVFESDGSGNLSRLYATAKSDKVSIRVNDYGAFLQRPELHNREVGRDFHPEVFFEVLGYPLKEWLMRELDRPRAYKDRTFELDNKGILHLFVRTHIVTPQGKEYDVEKKMSFDTQKGFRPVFYERKFKYPDGSWNGKIVRLQWARFDSTWYVSAFEYNDLPSNHGHTVGKVENFKHNVEVSDEEFTLDGMDVPDGLLVDDGIRGVSYYYGTRMGANEDLEHGLEKADFVQKIQSKKTTLASDKVDANAGKQIADQNQLQATIDESVQSKRIDDSLWPRGLAITGIVVIIGVVVYLGYRYFIT